MKRGRYGDEDSEEEGSSSSYNADAVPVEDMSYQELRHALKLRGLQPKGKKVDLVKQLQELREKEDANAGLRMKDMARSESSIRAWTFGLNEDVLLNHVLNRLDAHSLLSFGSTCNAAFNIANRPVLWEALIAEKGFGEMEFRKSELRDAKFLFGKAALQSCEPKLRFILALTRAECVRCGTEFSHPLNTPKSCLSHIGDFGPKSYWNHDEYVWTCCDAEDEDEVGCSVGAHSADPQDARMEVGQGQWYF